MVSVVGLAIGIGLFSGMLFFVEASSRSMTRRALSPISLDMQRVLSAPLGPRLTLCETIDRVGSITPGSTVTLSITVGNEGTEPANDVVLGDDLPDSLTYVPGSTRLDGMLLADVAGASPVAQGLTGAGLTIGSLKPGRSTTLIYSARAERAVEVRTSALSARASSREENIPIRADAPSSMTLDRLQSEVRKLPGVTSAEKFLLFDLSGGSVRRDRSILPQSIRVFGLAPAYLAAHPSVRLHSGRYDGKSALVSVELARALALVPGSKISMTLPDGTRTPPTAVGGVADFSHATQLFSSRKSKKLDDFLYVPMSLVVGPDFFERWVLPAYARAASTPGRITRNGPLVELDIAVDRSTMPSSPSDALARTKSVAESVMGIAPGRDYLIDNVSNALAVASDDSRTARQLFAVLGLPGLLLAAFLAMYAGKIFAEAQRRQDGLLRLRGADRSQLQAIVLARSCLLAGVGAIAGGFLGILAAAVFLGRRAVSEIPMNHLLLTGAEGVAIGLVTTVAATFLPVWHALRRTIADELNELNDAVPAPWIRRLAVAMLIIGLAGHAIGGFLGVFDGSPGSVSSGKATRLPLPMLLFPVVAATGAMLIGVDCVRLLISRRKTWPTGFGSVSLGLVTRSLRRRTWAVSFGTLGVGLVTVFGLGVATFASTYDAGKKNDSEFANGADIRVTSPAEERSTDRRVIATALRIPGVAAVSPVVFGLDNSVLIGEFDQDRENLAAIDPKSFRRVALSRGLSFRNAAWDEGLDAIQTDNKRLFLGAEAADNLSIEVGDTVQVLLARGTAQQSLESFRVAGVFDHFPGFPQGVDVVVDIGRYEAATGLKGADFFLAATTRTRGTRHADVERAVASLQSSVQVASRHAGASNPFGKPLQGLTITSAKDAIDKDRSSLVAVDAHALARLCEMFSVFLNATCIGLVVLGMMVLRRREFAFLRANGLSVGRMSLVIAAEAIFVTVLGTLFGLAVGMLVGPQYTDVLGPLFAIRPVRVVPLDSLTLICVLSVVAAFVSSLAAVGALHHDRISEYLRET